MNATCAAESTPSPMRSSPLSCSAYMPSRVLYRHMSSSTSTKMRNAHARALLPNLRSGSIHNSSSATLYTGLAMVPITMETVMPREAAPDSRFSGQSISRTRIARPSSTPAITMAS